MLTTRRLWQCRSCRKQTSLTAGTTLHRSRLPLTTWFWATYLVASLKPGISALQLSQQLGLRYETGWMLLHKLRRAMVNPNRDKLRGVVEVDETWIGGKQAGLKGGRQLKDRKALLVAVAVERRETAASDDGSRKATRYLGRLRMAVVPDHAPGAHGAGCLVARAFAETGSRPVALWGDSLSARVALGVAALDDRIGALVCQVSGSRLTTA
jgi:hypothetical protein